MKKLKILTRHDISSAYSCLQYLAEELKNEFDLELWSATNKDKFTFLKDPSINHSFLDSWYGNIRKVRVLLVWLHAFLVLLKDKSDFVINDIDFFPVGYIIKRLCPQRKFIMYFTEINGEDVKTFQWIEKFYKKHANVPDMTIECLKERAKYRSSQFGISNKVYYINNTISMKEIKEAEATTVCREKYIPDSFKEKTVVFYAGGCNITRDLGTFIKEISKIKEVCFLAFCYGTQEELKNVKNMCSNYFEEGFYVVHEAVPRQILLNVMNFADIGIVYYDPKYSVNHKYASPSKFFEYMAKGLNILSSNNEGINHIINDNSIGECIMENEEISLALKRLLNRGLKEKKDIIEIFNNKYAYEVDSRKTIQELKKILKG